MTKTEWYTGSEKRVYKWKNLAKKEIDRWKSVNNITEKCFIHHRDDTEEARKYNDEHYELWGFNEDGTFEYGKYVVFMTHSEHSAYHKHGEKHHNFGKKGTQSPLFGRHCKEETKHKISVSNRGKKRSEEAKERMRYAAQFRPPITEETRNKISKSLKGHIVTKETRNKLRANNVKPMLGKHPSLETRQKVSDSLKRSVKLQAYRFLFKVYRDNGGVMCWNVFKHALKTGDVTFV